MDFSFTSLLSICAWFAALIIDYDSCVLQRSKMFPFGSRWFWLHLSFPRRMQKACQANLGPALWYYCSGVHWNQDLSWQPTVLHYEVGGDEKSRRQWKAASLSTDRNNYSFCTMNKGSVMNKCRLNLAAVCHWNYSTEWAANLAKDI